MNAKNGAFSTKSYQNPERSEMDIEIIYNETMGYYISVDVYGIFAESSWYRTKEKLAFAMATNTIKWHATEIEYDKDDVDGAWA